MTVELKGGGYEVRLDPGHGAAILSAVWTGPDGRATSLLAPLSGPAAGFKAGCFAMLPFANRIDRGRFTFNGCQFRLPVNLPAEDMAIHGFSRDNPWQVVGQAAGRVLLSQDFGGDGNPYRYHAEQEMRLSEGGIRIALSVRNEGAQSLPFGIGLHPWFPRTPLTTLSFEAEGTYRHDDRGLPVAPLGAVPSFAPLKPAPLGTLGWFDGCFAGWRSRRARLSWPELGVALGIEADGALRHLHVFVPDNRDVVCAEPVSHLPDAVNRPELGTSGAMDVLEPGATLSGSMILNACSAANVQNP